MQILPVKRRRVLQILAVGSGISLLEQASGAKSGRAGSGRAGSGRAKSGRANSLQPHYWNGIALGAPASIILYHPDKVRVQQVLSQIEAEIFRLEQEFSLYRPDSALCRLNRQGYLEQPSIDMLRLLSEAHSISTLTAGAFDVSVQPLWHFYQALIQQPDRTLAQDTFQDALLTVLDRVDYRAIDLQSHRISLRLPGMALTLNGIAQGYITDRIAERLRAADFDRVLLNLGEIRGLGAHPDGRPWQVGVPDPADPSRWIERLALQDQAIATSAAAGTRFDAEGRYHHLFDPRSGQCRHDYDSVSVIAANATLADALATALYQISPDEVYSTLALFKPVRAILRQTSGHIIHYG